jgi:hypothetical protein
MRNFSDKNYQNMHFSCNFLIVPLKRLCGKIEQGGRDHNWQYGASELRAEYRRLRTYIRWYLMWYILLQLGSHWWQLFSTHMHTNNTGNVTKQTINRTTQKIHRATQKLGRVRDVPRLCGYHPGIWLTTEEKAQKNFS